jgi:hypothetical protein
MARGKMKIKAASTFGGCGLKKKYEPNSLTPSFSSAELRVKLRT